MVVAIISLQSCKENETLKPYDKVSNVILEKYSNKDFDTLIVVQDNIDLIFLNKEGKLDKGFSFTKGSSIILLCVGILLGALMMLMLFRMFQ